MKPIRKNHILDLILASQPYIISDISIIPGISDHKAIASNPNIGRKRSISAKRKIYLYHLHEIKARLHNFYSSFISSNPYIWSICWRNWILFKQCILNKIDELVPAKCIKNHQNLPWVNKDIRYKIKKRKKLHDHAKLTGNSSSWAQYKNQEWNYC